jgi:hypothetical protein
MPMATSIAQLSAPAGLGNLGNTCYLNSSLQVRLARPRLPLLRCAHVALRAALRGARGTAQHSSHARARTLGHRTATAQAAHASRECAHAGPSCVHAGPSCAPSLIVLAFARFPPSPAVSPLLSRLARSRVRR